jgi:hypothetical protein
MRQQVNQLEVSPTHCPPRCCTGRRTGSTSAVTGRRAPLRLASSRQMAEVLAHPVDRRSRTRTCPGTMVWARSSICQDRAAPLEMVYHQPSRIEPAFMAKFMPSARALHQAGDADLVLHLGELAAATRPSRDAGAGVGSITGSGLVEVVLSPPHMTVACRSLRPLARRRPARPGSRSLLALRYLASSRAPLRGGGGVVDEMAPLAMPAKAPRSQHHAAQVVVIADAGEDDLRRLGRPRPGCRRLPPWVSAPFLRLGLGAVIRPSPRGRSFQMAGHRKAHHTQAEKRRLHRSLPLVYRCV